MDNQQTDSQYSLLKIFILWAMVALPLAFMGWVVFPAVAPEWGVDPMGMGFARMATITVALVWQFVLALFIVSREEGSLNWATIKRRLRLNTPHDPKTGEPSRKMWRWLVPLVLLHFAGALFISGALDELSVKIFPFLEPPGDGYVLGDFLMSDDAPSYFAGAWSILGMFVVMAVFNILGEELFWRGIMLPKMRGAFSKWDGVANGVIGGAYHLSQPWQILGGGIFMWTAFMALPAKYFKSTWVSMIIHGSINVMWFFMILRLVM